MSNLCGSAGKKNLLSNGEDLKESINLTGKLTAHSGDSRNFVWGVSYFERKQQEFSRHFEDERFVGFLAGDILNMEVLDWNDIFSAILKSDFHWMKQVRGYFAFAVYHKKESKLYLISDHFGFLPVYYGNFEEGLVFSTRLNTFSLLNPVPAIRKEWFYDLMYFTFVTGDLSPLDGIFKLPASSVLEYTIPTGTYNLRRYADKLMPERELIKGKEALDHSMHVLRTTLPKYYTREGLNLHAMTGGLDSIMSFSQAPVDAEVETYTYGVPGSRDLHLVRKRRKKLEGPHTEILFDAEFTDQLPELIYETVRLSGGTQSINRSTLLYVYRYITRKHIDPPVILSGIMADTLFRGHMGVPNVYSPEMESFFKTGVAPTDTVKFKSMFSGSMDDFRDYVDASTKSIIEYHGKPTDRATHLSYSTHAVGTRYYNGEFNLANSYGVFRAPFFDYDIVKLAHETELSVLSFSAFQEQKIDPFRKNMLHAEVIGTARHFEGIHYEMIPLKYWRTCNTLSAKTGRLIYRAYSRYARQRQKYAPLEDWGSWFRQYLSREFDGLLDVDSHVSEFFRPDFIKRARETNDAFWLSRLASAEIFIRLMQNKWKFPGK